MQKSRNSGTAELPDLKASSFPERKHLTDALPQSMYLVDTEGHMVRWSPWFRDRIAGCSEEEMAKIDFLQLIHPEDRQLLAQRMRNILDQGIEESVEVRILLKGGPSYRWFLLMANRFEHDGNYYVIGTGIDITRIKKAGMALMLSEQRFRSMFEQSDAPVFISGTDGAIVYVSPAFENISGYALAECKGKPFMQFFEEAESGQMHAMFADVIATPAAVRMQEFRMRRKDGVVCYIELKLQQYHDHRTEGTIGVLYDLTQRKRLESLTEFRLGLLEQSEKVSIEELLQSALDEAELLTDSTFGFIYFLSGESVTSTKCIWSARIRDRMTAMSRNGVQHPFDITPFMKEAVETKRAVIVNEYGQHAHPGFSSAHPLVSRSITVPVLEGGTVAAVFFVGNKPSAYHDNDAQWVGTLADLVWDIVARKRAEKSESRIQSILLQIQKMELIGQLAGGVAHDFNNMLGVIIGNTELALSSDELDPSVEENLQEIYRAAERSAEMTSQLLAFARKQTAVPKVLDIDAAVSESLALLQRVVGEKIDLEWRSSESECQVRIDPSQLDQILMNLCLNARDAMNGAGKITIESRKIRIDSSVVNDKTIRRSGDYVVISVIDSGKGIPEKNKPHIFEPFFTTRELGKGTGLGLSSVYGIVKQNRGFVDFESQEYKGSSFHVYLPLFRKVSEPVACQTGKVPECGSGSTILVVEDEPEILSLCTMMLEKSGFHVLSAASPSEAIMIAEECSGKIDLLLTDIVMPEMNGTDLTSKLLTISPGFRVLFMSGYSADMIASHDVSKPAINVIRKPFTFKALAEKVREALDVE
jgi:two-component system cell cycle sensor histidine kinase/response regulator CckA